MATTTTATWRTVLEGWMAYDLFQYVRGCTPMGDMVAQKALSQAEEELSLALGVEYTLEDGLMKYEKPERNEYSFSERAVRGFKVALVQAITGAGSVKLPEPIGQVKRRILPIARALRIESYVRKDAKWLEGPDDTLDFHPDEVEEITIEKVG